jgi:hypothetical protein
LILDQSRTQGQLRVVSNSSQPLYLATRHFFGWYLMNVAGVPPHRIALQLGHTDGGRLVGELYGHPDAAIARQAIRDALRSTATVTPLVTPLVTTA